MSLKQKRLQLLTKFSNVIVGLANPGRQTVLGWQVIPYGK